MVLKGGAIYKQESEILEPEHSLDFETELPITEIEITPRNPEAIKEEESEIHFEYYDSVHKDHEHQYILQ